MIWTKQAAITRTNQNALLQEAMQIEPALRDVINSAAQQMNISGYNRIGTWYELKPRFSRLVGFQSPHPQLKTMRHWDAVAKAINDLLPPDNVDLANEPDPVDDKQVPTGRLSLRFTILRRDNYRCQLCGASAQDGAQLEVDHRVARVLGGTNDPTNLWTLCFNCNRGKFTRPV